MSAEQDFRAALVAHAALTALVGTRVALNAVPDGAALPAVIYTATHVPEFGLNNTKLGNNVQFEVQCWAETSAGAEAVADAVEDALLAASTVCTSRSTTYDPELGLDGVVLAADWWE